MADTETLADIERDIRISIWNAGKWQGKPDEVALSLLRKAMEEPPMQRALKAIAALSNTSDTVRVPRELLADIEEAAICLDEKHRDDSDIWESAAAMSIRAGTLRKIAALSASTIPDVGE